LPSSHVEEDFSEYLPLVAHQLEQLCFALQKGTIVLKY
jgi:hypothetical protein